MGYRERLQALIEEENRLERIKNTLKSRLSTNENVSSNLKRQEKDLLSKLSKVEGETFEILTNEEGEISKFLQKNREFIEWYTDAIEKLSEHNGDFEEMENNMEQIFQMLPKNFSSLRDGKINLKMLGWEQEVVKPARKVSQTLQEIEEDRERILEDMSDNKWEMIQDERFISKQRDEIKELSKLLSEVEDIENAMGKANSRIGLSRDEVDKMKSNLQRIEEIEAEIEEVYERVEQQRNAFELAERGEFFEFAKELDLEKGKKKRVKEFLGRSESPEFVKNLETMKKLAQSGKVLNSKREEERIEKIESIYEGTHALVGDIEEIYSLPLKEKFTNRRKQWVKETGKNIGDMLEMSRRELLVNTGRVYAANTLLNIGLQKITGQDGFLDPKTAFYSSNKEMIKNILEGENAKIAVFNVYFEGEEAYDSEKAEEVLIESLSSLDGVRADVTWINIKPSVETFVRNNPQIGEELSEQRIEEHSGNLEKIVENSDFDDIGNSVGESESFYASSWGNSSDLVSNLQRGLEKYVDEETEDLLYSSETSKVFVSSFSGGHALSILDKSGISTVDALYGGSWALVKRDFSFSRTLNIVRHELGHKFSLPHTYSNDIMSYSLIKNSLEHGMQIGFGLESRINWNAVRKNFKKWNKKFTD
jgi:hypothetical protein